MSEYKPGWKPYMKRHKRWGEMTRKERIQIIKGIVEEEADMIAASGLKVVIEEEEEEDDER